VRVSRAAALDQVGGLLLRARAAANSGGEAAAGAARAGALWGGGPRGATRGPVFVARARLGGWLGGRPAAGPVSPSRASFLGPGAR
jgi:hypothetical protein